MMILNSIIPILAIVAIVLVTERDTIIGLVLQIAALSLSINNFLFCFYTGNVTLSIVNMLLIIILLISTVASVKSYRKKEVAK